MPVTRSIQNLDHLLALEQGKTHGVYEPASADNLPGNPVTERPGLTMAGNDVQENILIPTIVGPGEWQMGKGLSILNPRIRSRRSRGTSASGGNGRRDGPGRNGDGGLLGAVAC